jgi:predicted XRE-type DNA-binding protein
MKHKIHIEDSSSNVFADLSIKNPEEYLTKSELAAHILRIAQNRRLPQASAAKVLGITPPNASALLNGRLDGFSTDRLFRFLNKLGCDIQIKVSKPRTKSLGRVKVVAA